MNHGAIGAPYSASLFRLHLSACYEGALTMCECRQARLHTVAPRPDVAHTPVWDQLEGTATVGLIRLIPIRSEFAE
jgi:hypothetical protein